MPVSKVALLAASSWSLSHLMSVWLRKEGTLAIMLSVEINSLMSSEHHLRCFYQISY